MIFALSDTHLSFNSNKPMDKFGSIWHKHPDKIRQNCLDKMQDDDILLLPGDLSWASKLEQAKQDLAFLAAIPGSKILLRGNHDYWWSTLNKMRNLAQAENWSSLYFMQNNAYLISQARADADRQISAKYPLIYASDTLLRANLAEQAAAIKEVERAKLNKHKFYLLIGCKGYLLKPEFNDQHDAELAYREFQRLTYSYEQGLLLLEMLKLVLSELELIGLSHYPPLLKTYQTSKYTQFYKELAAIFKQVHVLYGHLHGLGIKEAFTGEKANIKYSLVSADALSFAPLEVR